jgi:hypothetical protein
LKKLRETLDSEFNTKEIKQRIQMLIMARTVWQKELDTLTKKQDFNGSDEVKRLELQQRISVIETLTNQYFMQYTTILTESLNEESKKLNKFTVVLISLTAILSASVIFDFMLRIFHL